MKKLVVCSMVIGAVMLLTGSQAFADNVGYLDMQKIFQNYEEAKSADKAFQDKQKEYQTELEEKQKEIAEKKKDIKNDEELQKLIKESEEELMPKQQELLRLQNELTTKIQKTILDAGQKVAKEYGIDVILDRRVVLMGGFDLTDFVLENLRK